MNRIIKIRERLSMNFDWLFYPGDIIVEPGKGHLYNYSHTKAGGIDGPARSDWNTRGWRKVNLPHDWALEQEFDPEESVSQGFKHRGVAWYRKSFLLDEDDRQKQLLIEFDGIVTNAVIYFNGSIVERNWCGYTSFVVDISDLALYGNTPNTLAVRVDALKWEGWWYEGAGIYRHVWLTKKSDVHISHWGTWVKPQKLTSGFWNTKIETKIENSGDQDIAFELISYINDSCGTNIALAKSKGFCTSREETVVNQSIVLENPCLWELDSPNLYTAVSELYVGERLMDTLETTYGYRTIRFCADTGFYLNDKPLKIKGTCNHQDHAGVGVAVPDSLNEYRIQRLKDMGSNAYRCAHGNPSKEVLDTCDRLGMLVMDENRNFDSSPEGLKQLESMVKRDRNHPCVFMYSIFNEEPLQGTLQGRKMAKRMIYKIKQLDDTRPVLAAMNGGVMEDEGVADITDITGFNYMTCDYDKFHAKYPTQPVLGSENNCAYSTRGVYESNKENRTFNCYDEEKAIWGNTIRETWQAVNSRAFVMGLFVWTGFDYRGEPAPYEWPTISSNWGIMDTCGFAKDAFFLHKACWTDEPMVHILPHWNWSGREGQLIKVMSHTNCNEVELFINNESLGVKPSPAYEQAVWLVPYTPGILKMIGYKNGIKAAKDEVETTEEAIALCLKPFREFLYGDGGDSIPVQVCAIDREGRFVPTAQYKIKFFIEGSARIIGVGNGNPNCLESDTASERSLFNGLCQVVLQSLHGNDTVKLRAEAEGLKSSDLVLNIHPKDPKPMVESVFDRFIDNWRMTQNIFTERPDPNMEIDSCDMNSWECITVGYGPQKRFEGVKGYALYRSIINLDKNDSLLPHLLYFYEVIGIVEVYLNGEKIFEKDCTYGSDLQVPLRAGLEGDITITVLIKAGDYLTRSGICKSVILK